MSFKHPEDENQVLCNLVEHEIREVTEWPRPNIAKPGVERRLIPTARFRLFYQQVAHSFDGGNEAERNVLPGLFAVVAYALFQVFDRFLLESDAARTHVENLRSLAAGQGPQTLEELGTCVLEVAAVEGSQQLLLQRLLAGAF